MKTRKLVLKVFMDLVFGSNKTNCIELNKKEMNLKEVYKIEKEEMKKGM